MGTKDSKSEKGKGGNFDTKRNPFQAGMRMLGGYPELTSTPEITRAIDAALKAGCAVMIGTTRDQGATVITILDGDDRHKTFCSNDEQLQAASDSMREMYAD